MRAPLILASIWTFVSILHYPFVTAEAEQLADGLDNYCSGALFGYPNPNDCIEAMRWIPYFSSPGGSTKDPATAIRQFVEPQFLDPPFSPVSNPYAPLAIVQMPKIWKHSMPYS